MSQRLDQITDQAALWFVRAQDPGFSATDRAEFASWLAASAEHVLEYLALAAVSCDIREASADLDVDALISLARESGEGQNVVELSGGEPAFPREPEPVRRKARHPAVWLAAASLSIAVAAGLWFLFSSEKAVYSTEVGEQAKFSLADGSVVTLNARSVLAVEYTQSQRAVRMVAGEVLFDVAKDPDRPFRVMTDRAMIRAVGTSFNVRVRGGATRVTVVEGSVEVRLQDAARPHGAQTLEPPDAVAPPGEEASPSTGLPARNRSVRVEAGQQVRLEKETPEVVVVEANIEKATAWRQRRLVFDAWQLSEVAAEFNLYSDRRIVIEDRELASRPVSGAFDADDPESFVLFLSAADLAVVERLEDGVMVLRRPRDKD